MEQDQMNLMARAMLEYLAANPIAGINVAQATNVYHMLQTFRKYSGAYAATQWLRDFERERTAYNLDSTWCIQNLDRVLEGTPLTWWNSRKVDYFNRLGANNAVPDDIWTQVQENLRAFFSEVNIKDKARLELSTIKYAIGQDPMDYVARKVECMMRYNPNMEIDEQIKNLLLGLPEQLRALVSPADLNSVDQFFRKLSQQVSLHRKNLEQSQGTSRNFQAVAQRDNRPRGNQRVRPRRIPGLRVPQYSDEHKAACIDQQGRRLCWHCKRPNHVVFMFYELARAQNINVRGNQMNQNDNHQDGDEGNDEVRPEN